MLHAVGGWETSGEYIDMPLENRKEKYIEANEKNYETSKNNESISGDFNNESILDAIKYCYEFQKGNVDFITGETKAALYANIVCVASAFNEEIAGLWKSSRTAREVVDSLYIQVQSQKMPKSYVDALAKSLKFTDLFDFYKEIEILNNS